MEKRLKVLLCCYSCDPYAGSELGMGWNFAKNIGYRHDAHVLVNEKYREHIEQRAKEHPEEVEHLTFHYIPKRKYKLLRKLVPMSYYWVYRQWHKRAYRYAVELDKKENFDLIHMVTMGGFREPSLLWKINKPFVWGPTGGLTDSPWCLLPCIGFSGAWALAQRNILNAIQKRWGISCHQAAKRAKVILTKTDSDQKEMRRLWHIESEQMTEIGWETHHKQYPASQHEPGTPLHICWAGVHEPRKALEILLYAIARCKQPVVLHVLSKGPRTPIYRKLIKQLGIEDKVIIHGFVEREESFRIMSNSHIFCITSLRDDTPTVIFEALRYSLPLIVLDHSGFSSVVNENCGIKIPITDKETVINAYAEHIDFFATHEDERRRIAQGAQDRCKDFTWEAKMDQMDKVYERALS